MIILGFDPGGQNQFGWCVTRSTKDGLLSLHASGLAHHAAEAVDAAFDQVGDTDRVEAAGIDSPLFWVADGDREVDKIVRNAIKRLGAANASGTVSHVNSLRGACLIQGILAAHLLRQRQPAIRITESHPKALLWLLRIASKECPVADVNISRLSELVESESSHLSEHERDAALGAAAALAMMERRSCWRDLCEEEMNAFTPVSPIEYWMPVA